MTETLLTVDWHAREIRIREVDVVAPRIRWRIIFTNFNEVSGDDGMAFMLADDQQVSVAFTAVDRRGNPARLDGAPVWSSSDPLILTVTPNDDNSAAVLAVGPTGTAQVQVTVDADIGSGIRNLVGILDVEVVAGEAVSLDLVPGTPTTQPI